MADTRITDSLLSQEYSKISPEVGVLPTEQQSFERGMMDEHFSFYDRSSPDNKLDTTFAENIWSYPSNYISTFDPNSSICENYLKTGESLTPFFYSNPTCYHYTVGEVHDKPMCFTGDSNNSLIDIHFASHGYFTRNTPTKPKRRRVQTQSQRKAANIRERKRMYNVNSAFETLKKKVPTFSYEKRLSRIETLKLAIDYIAFMTDVLNGKSPTDIPMSRYLNPKTPL